VHENIITASVLAVIQAAQRLLEPAARLAA
jgi:hypothetical protein